MNRRRPLVALAIALPLALFGVAKYTASWRPVAVGRLLVGSSSSLGLTIEFYGDQVVELSSGSAFDIATGAPAQAPRANIVGQGAWTWEVNYSRLTGHSTELLLREGAGAALVYPLKPTIGDGPPGATRIRLTPAIERLEALVGKRYYRWHTGSRALERVFDLPDPHAKTISRDGTTVIGTTPATINFVFTDGTRPVKRVALRGFSPLDGRIELSPYGEFALYGASNKNGPSSSAHVVETRSGRALWKYKLGAPSSAFGVAFSPDERELALPLAKRKRWEVRDAKTGRVRRTLPMVPHAAIGTFSPDGDTLYSVADGVLYRQRAR